MADQSGSGDAYFIATELPFFNSFTPPHFVSYFCVYLINYFFTICKIDFLQIVMCHIAWPVLLRSFFYITLFYYLYL
jgi:hypothetical protein